MEPMCRRTGALFFTTALWATSNSLLSLQLENCHIKCWAAWPMAHSPEVAEEGTRKSIMQCKINVQKDFHVALLRIWPYHPQTTRQFLRLSHSHIHDLNLGSWLSSRGGVSGRLFLNLSQSEYYKDLCPPKAVPSENAVSSVSDWGQGSKSKAPPLTPKSWKPW